MVVLTPNQCYEIKTNSRPVKYKVLILADELNEQQKLMWQILMCTVCKDPDGVSSCNINCLQQIEQLTQISGNNQLYSP